MSRTSWSRLIWRPSSAAVARAISSLLLLGAALGPIAVGCADPPQPPKQPCDKQFVTLQIYGSGTVNPNENGNPRPVSVRLYQLGSDLKLQNARYDDILLKDDETLGKDVVNKDDVTVYPNDLVEIKYQRDPAADFLGGVAFFHEPRGQAWKTFYEYPPIPGEGSCGSQPGKEAPQNDVKVQFFVDEAKIDNGSQYDPDMFPKSQSVRKLSLPKKSPPGGDGAPAAPAAK